MRFIVRRASSPWDGKPCDEATLQAVTRTESYTPGELRKNQRLSDTWFEIGHNHREGAKGRQMRDQYADEWIVEADSPMELFERHGEVVIRGSIYNDIDAEILIYDDYIE